MRSRRADSLAFVFPELPHVAKSLTLLANSDSVALGPDLVDQYRQASGYTDRVLKGEKPADLPVQAPTKYQIVLPVVQASKFELVINLPAPAQADRQAWPRIFGSAEIAASESLRPAGKPQ
jgi:hypothetical protein